MQQTTNGSVASHSIDSTIDDTAKTNDIVAVCNNFVANYFPSAPLPYYEKLKDGHRLCFLDVSITTPEPFRTSEQAKQWLYTRAQRMLAQMHRRALQRFEDERQRKLAEFKKAQDTCMAKKTRQDNANGAFSALYCSFKEVTPPLKSAAFQYSTNNPAMAVAPSLRADSYLDSAALLADALPESESNPPANESCCQDRNENMPSFAGLSSSATILIEKTNKINGTNTSMCLEETQQDRNQIIENSLERILQTCKAFSLESTHASTSESSFDQSAITDKDIRRSETCSGLVADTSKETTGQVKLQPHTHSQAALQQCQYSSETPHAPDFCILNNRYKNDQYPYVCLVKDICIYYRLGHPEYEIVRENDVYCCTAVFNAINFVSPYCYDKISAKNLAAEMVSKYIRESWSEIFANYNSVREVLINTFAK